MMIKENDYYFEGLSSDTFTLSPVPYRRGTTEPGGGDRPLLELIAARGQAKARNSANILSKARVGVPLRGR